SFDKFGNSDAQGVYRFSRVPLGSFSVQAVAAGIFATASGLIASDGQTVSLDLSLPAANSVFGAVYSSDGVTPIAFARLSLVNLDSFGGEGFFQRFASGDSFGNYQFSSVQSGTIQVSAVDPANRASAGIATMQLPATPPLNLNITLGNAWDFRTNFFQLFNLDGTGGFRYDVSCNGELSDGGTVDRHLNDAYDGVYFLNVGGGSSGTQFPCLFAGLLEAG